MFEDSTHGGRQNWWLRYPTFLRTSTHALTEGDADIFCRFLRQKISTHALTEGDRLRLQLLSAVRISTHALTEGDLHQLPCSFHYLRYFNSRPHGGRRSFVAFISSPVLFQLTPSRRATIPRLRRLNDLSAFQLTPSRRATANLDKFFF